MNFQVSTAGPVAPYGSSLGWMEGVARWLIQRAARHAPPALSERLEEEWLADLATRPGWLSRLLLGLGCCWATRVIGLDQLEFDFLATPVAADAITRAYKPHDSLSFCGDLVMFLLLGAWGLVLLPGYSFLLLGGTSLSRSALSITVVSTMIAVAFIGAIATGRALRRRTAAAT